jgi:hypothetical protein
MPNTKRMKVRKDRDPTGEQAFFERLVRENRYDEFTQTRERIEAETPLATTQGEKLKRGRAVKAAAMKACGYDGPDKERALWLYHAGRAERMAAGREAGAQQKTFEAALKTLPAKADDRIENEWVMAHAAISRKSREPEKQVIITGNDLLDADHGPCPSRAAANKLQYWANKPEKAFEAMTISMKKVDVRESENSEVVMDDGISELEHAVKLLGAK